MFGHLCANIAKSGQKKKPRIIKKRILLIKPPNYGQAGQKFKTFHNLIPKWEGERGMATIFKRIKRLLDFEYYMLNNLVKP